MTRLSFQGEYPLAMIVVVGTAVGVAVGWYYRRETLGLAAPLSWLLPTLRGAAIFLTLMMLAGPVLQRTTEIGEVGRVDVFVDASGSMLATDLASATGVSPEGTTGVAPEARTVGQNHPDAKTRLQRAAELLLGGAITPGWLQSVRETHHVYLHKLVDDDAVLIWDSRSDLPIPRTLDAVDVTPSDTPSQALAADERPPATGTRTNLADPIAGRVMATEGLGGLSDSAPDAASSDAAPESSVGGSVGVPRRAVLLLTDGQHNSGGSPQKLAQRLGDAAVPLFAIGLGSRVEPRDVAVLGINVPPSVSATGRASGEVTIKDLAGEGERIRLRIMMGGETVWQKTLASEGRPTRRVPFDFAVGPLVSQVQTADVGGIERTRVTLPLAVVIDPTEGQYDAGNDRLDFRISANLRKRRLLIVDSRSRWETRYIRNLFDRDPTWQVDAIYAWPRSSGGRVRRYFTEGTFPPDAQTMASYDAVIWGDCGPDAFTEDELRRLREFASQGGAVVFIDGDRDGLARMAQSPAGPLMPVRLTDQPLLAGVRRLRPTPIGSGQSALRLAGDAGVDDPVDRLSDDGLSDAQTAVWNRLIPPTTIRDVEVLPGSEVWLEAEMGESSPPAPVLVTRLFGGGQVVYLATDQTWRWRYRVADRYHTRFWNQLLEAIMQPPFEVRDQYVAIATGAPQYTAGESATIRARLRDASGRPVGDAVVEAVMRDQSGSARTVLLRSVDADRGVYEGKSLPLRIGEFDVSIRSAGYQSSQSVRTSLLVVPPPDRESVRLALDGDLLSTLARDSGGVYADESDADQVWQAIRPLSDGRIETRRLALSQSYYWFVGVLGLLTAEWWLRKKAGLV